MERLLSPHDLCIAVICRLASAPNNSKVLGPNGQPCRSASQCSAVFHNFLGVRCNPGSEHTPSRARAQRRCLISRH
eukprot:2807324-Rhodomonas_salina.1